MIHRLLKSIAYYSSNTQDITAETKAGNAKKSNDRRMKNKDNKVKWQKIIKIKYTLKAYNLQLKHTGSKRPARQVRQGKNLINYTKFSADFTHRCAYKLRH